MKLRKTIFITAILAALPAGQAFAGGMTDIPDHTGLHQLAVETSLFLLEDFKLPSDDKATIYRDADGYVRVDYFTDGHRVSRGEIPVGSIYCAVMAHAGVLGYTETSKRFQVAGIYTPNPAPREGEQGVGIELRSVQSSKILSISCYQPTYAPLPITVQALRQVVRMSADASAVAFLGPPQAGPVMAEVESSKTQATYTAGLSAAASEPVPVMARRPSATTAKSYQSLDQAHRQYVKLVKKQAAGSVVPQSLTAQ